MRYVVRRGAVRSIEVAHAYAEWHRGVHCRVLVRLPNGVLLRYRSADKRLAFLVNRPPGYSGPALLVPLVLSCLSAPDAAELAYLLTGPTS